MQFDVPEGWTSATIADVACDDGIAGGPFGSNLGRKDYIEDGVPVIRGTNLSGDGFFNGDDFVFVSEEKADTDLRRNQAVPGDIVATQRGTLGQVGLVPHGPYPRYIVSQSQMRLRVNAEVADRDFVYYVIDSEWMRRLIVSRAITVGVPHINLGIFGELPIPLPPLAEQVRIAGLLRTMDTAAEVVRLTRDRLAALSVLILRHEVELAGSEWTVANLPAVARFVNGKNFTKGAEGTGRPVVRIKELNSGLGPSTVYSEQEVPHQHQADFFDLLFPWSGSLGIYRWEGPEGLVNQHIFKVIPHEGFPMWFVEGWLRNHLAEFQAIARDKAVTIGHIQRKHLDEAEVLIPSPDEMRRLDALLGPLDALREAKAREGVRLAAVRTELMGKLLLGRLRVDEDYEPGEPFDPGALVAA